MKSGASNKVYQSDVMAAASASRHMSIPEETARMKCSCLRWARGVVLAGVVLALAAIVACVCAKRALFVEGGNAHADVIVVLGGDAGNRVFRALQLYKSGAASRILISGSGDCYEIRDRFVLAGVNTNALLIKPNSANTKENAAFSIQVMKEQGMKRAIVVTSWYHSRRALACFSHFGRGIKLASYPCYDAPDMKHKPSSYELQHVFREYFALAGYLMLYGIKPDSHISDNAGVSQAKVSRATL
jgi:uncharacterized SAM-binding protein YcdF (DUF218 family)